MHLPDKRLFQEFIKLSDRHPNQFAESVQLLTHLSSEEKALVLDLLHTSTHDIPPAHKELTEDQLRTFEESLSKWNISIVRELGSGGMGVVYEGFDKESNRRVAIKRLHNFLSKEQLNSIGGEVNHLASLSHTNICSLYFSARCQISEDQFPYFVMEYVDGQPIDRYLALNRLSADEVKSLVVQLLEALTHSHSLGIIHRDLKPSNILVTQKGDLKVLDFGISAICQPSDSNKRVSQLGTPGYASPEQVAGKPPAPSMDIYSFGVLLESIVGSQTLDRGQIPRGFGFLSDLSIKCKSEHLVTTAKDLLNSVRSPSEHPHNHGFFPARFSPAFFAIGLSFLTFTLGRSCGYSQAILKPLNDSLSGIQTLDWVANSIDSATYSRSGNFHTNFKYESLPTEGLTAEAAVISAILESSLHESQGDLEYAKSAIDDCLNHEKLSETSSIYKDFAICKQVSLLCDLDKYGDATQVVLNHGLDSFIPILKADLLCSLLRCTNWDSVVSSQIYLQEDEAVGVMIDCLARSVDTDVANSRVATRLITQLVNRFALPGTSISDLPDGLLNLVELYSRRSAEWFGQSDRRWSDDVLYWEAWQLSWAGKSIAAEEKLRARASYSAMQFGLESAEHWHHTYDLLYFLFNSYGSSEELVELATDLHIGGLELFSDKSTHLWDSGWLLLRCINSRCFDLWEYHDASRLQAVRSIQVILSKEALAVSEYLSTFTDLYPAVDRIWSELFIERSVAAAFSGDDKKSLAFLNSALELEDSPVLSEVYRCLVAEALHMALKDSSAANLLIKNIRNAVENSRSDESLRYEKSVRLLAFILDPETPYESQRLVNNDLRFALSIDRDFLRCLNIIETSMKSCGSIRDRPVALLRLAFLYLNLDQPIPAARLLSESLKLDLQEYVINSQSPTFFLKPDEQGWWDLDVSLMLKAIQLSTKSGELPEVVPYAKDFVVSAEQAKKSTAWFDVESYDRLLEAVSEFQP